MRKPKIIYRIIPLLVVVTASLTLAKMIVPDSMDPRLVEYQDPKTPADRKKQLAADIEANCPLTAGSSEFSTISSQANTLLLAAQDTPSLDKTCQDKLSEMKSNLGSLDKIQQLANTGTINKDNPVQMNELSDNLRASNAAVASIQSLLTEGCKFSNSPKSVTSISNQIIGAIEGGSALLSYAHPGAALVGVGASAAGRLIVALTHWLAKSNYESDVDKAKDDGKVSKFASDLCHFKRINSRYNEIAAMPSSAEQNKKLEEMKTAWEQSAAELTKLRCEVKNSPVDDSISSAQAISAKLAKLKEDPGARCRGFFLNFGKGNPEAKAALDNFSKKKNCDKTQDESETTQLFCQSWKVLNEKLSTKSASDCNSDPQFAKDVAVQVTNIQEVMETIITNDGEKGKSKQSDLLGKLREKESEANDRKAAYDGLLQIVKPAPGTQIGAKESLDRIGRKLLGNDFDKVYAKHFSEAGKRTFDESRKDLKKLRESKPDSDTRKQLCSSISGNYSATHDAYRVLNDACGLFARDGIPKSNGDFDRMSQGGSSKSITDRCGKYQADINSRMTSISSDIATINQYCP